MFQRITFCFIVCFFGIALTACAKNDFETRTFYAMDTFLSVTIHKDDMKHLDSAIEYINKLANNITADEERIASASLNTDITVGDDFMALYNISTDFVIRSGGLYDPTVSTITKLYGFGTKDYQMPSDNVVNNAVNSAGFNNLAIVKHNTLRKTTPVEIHFGAAGKGYIADKAAEFLNGKGVNGFVINIGGDMIVSGDKRGKPFIIGITNPAKPNTVINIVNIVNKGVATSGNYERYFKDDNGTTINHIFDVNTGKSINNHSSVSVITENATLADIYATFYYTLQVDEIAKDCEKNNIPVLVIDHDNTMHKLCSWEKFEQQ